MNTIINIKTKPQVLKHFFILTILLVTHKMEPQTKSENHIKTTVCVNNFCTEKKENITYYDGLGRKKQIVQVKQSPTGKTVVIPIEYDFAGRIEKEYLPVPINSTTADFVPNSSIIQTGTQFYSNYFSDESPYFQYQYKAAPIDQVIAKAAPGKLWKMGSRHEITYATEVNTDEDAVIHYFARSQYHTNLNIYKPQLTTHKLGGTRSLYLKNNLFKRLITDENGQKNMEFKDGEGKIVLKRQTTYSKPSHWMPFVLINYDTYYVYDEYDRLTYIMPPRLSDLYKNTIPTDWQILMDELGYQYRYDNKNRIVEKKLPGKAWEYLIYDQQNRLVGTQDGIQRQKGIYNFMQYDQFGRLATKGYYHERSMSRNMVQVSANYRGTNNIVRASSFSQSGLDIFYSQNAYGTSSQTTFQLVNYYDNYDYSQTVPPNVIESGNLKLRGLQTGSYVLNNATEDPDIFIWSRNLIFYESRYLFPIRQQKYHNSGTDTYTIIDTEYDFAGKIKETVVKHKTPTISEIKIKEKFEYDDQERLKLHTHQINNSPIEYLAQNFYNELGQLTRKNIGNSLLSTPLQRIRYKYNIRNWLTEINNIKYQLFGPYAELFAYQINYTQIETSYPIISLTHKTLFNGNIAQVKWKTAPNNVIREYVYSYDDLYRLTSALSVNNALDILGAYSENIKYDKNGNLLSLKRYGDEETQNIKLINDLTYQYQSHSNKLLNITNHSSPLNATGFQDGNISESTGKNDYAYDLNGNLITDLNKGIETITYNSLNLPEDIIWTNGDKISYIYNAVGDKIMKIIQPINGVQTKIEYLDGFHYENGKLEFFPTAEGYVQAESNGIFTYIYHHKDHLGNVRLSYKKKEGGGLTILEENNYYPLGLRHSGYNQVNLTDGKYKYRLQGQEHQNELGLNWDSFTWRNYDPAIGQWTTMDPLAEQAPSWNPYNYSWNNPIINIDPDGRWANPVFGSDGTYRGNTNEGYTGDIIIYDGNQDFTAMSAEELLYDNFDINKQRGNGNTYDRVRNELSGNAKSKIWSHVVSQLEGRRIYDETFRMSDLKGGKIYFDSRIGASWLSEYNLGTGKGKITVTDKYRYETTVENIQSSIGVHEWYSHIRKNQGDSYSSHRLAYQNVINFKALWNNTTDSYKGFNLQRLRDYTEGETAQKKVNPLYQNLFYKYSKYSR